MYNSSIPKTESPKDTFVNITPSSSKKKKKPKKKKNSVNTPNNKNNQNNGKKIKDNSPLFLFFH
jgi:hypothetical protein